MAKYFTVTGMKLEEIRVCIARAPGTNCDAETQQAIEFLGARADVVHFHKFFHEKKLGDYHALVFPGGFSYGDHVRSGAIWAKQLVGRLARELKQFDESGKPVLGICNGMQVLIESGMLPGVRGISEAPEAAMATNARAHYECRWIFLRKQSAPQCAFAKNFYANQVISLPVAHGEGKFALDPKRERAILDELEANRQIVFRYCKQDGEPARGEYPFNPNGALDDVAALCNPAGNVFALMPHPERASFWWQLPDWTRTGFRGECVGLAFFRGLIDYCEKRF